MEMNNDMHKIFCKWNSGIEELAEYFQDKYNFDIDNEDIAATKKLLTEMAEDVPKIVGIALHGHDSKIKKVKAKGKTKTTERISIVLNDKKTAEKILHKLHDFSDEHGGFDICDIEYIVIGVTGDFAFHIEVDYMMFTREQAYGVYLISKQNNEYEIIFPPQNKACDKLKELGYEQTVPSSGSEEEAGDLEGNRQDGKA